MLFMAATWLESRIPRFERKIRVTCRKVTFSVGRAFLDGVLRDPAMPKLSISEHDEKVKVRTTSGSLHPGVVCGAWV